jgi:hypothetical protein
VVTAIGEAEEVDRDIGAPLLELFLARHPYLTAFAASPTCAIVRVERIAAGRVATEHRLRTSNALSVSETSSC